MGYSDKIVGVPVLSRFSMAWQAYMDRWGSSNEQIFIRAASTVCITSESKSVGNNILTN